MVGSQGRWYYHWFSVQLTNDKRERDWNLSSTFIDCLIFRNFLTLFHFWLNIFVGCFIYVLDSSNSSSITFWTSQFISSFRSNWIGIGTGKSNGSWTDKQLSHFSTAKEMSVKPTFLLPQQTDFEMRLKCCWNPSELVICKNELTRMELIHERERCRWNPPLMAYL